MVYAFILCFSKAYKITKINNYKKISLESSPFFNGYLRFFKTELTTEKWIIVTYELNGEIKISKEHQILLFQNINGLETKRPLLITFEENNQKTGALFGEGIWKWRAANFLNTNSFQEFDEFIGNLVQYLASNNVEAKLF